MTKRAALWSGIGIGLLLVGLWVIPIGRAAEFFQWARNYLEETGGQNAANDLAYARGLLWSYLGSVLISLGVVWYVFRFFRPTLIASLALLLWAVVRVLWVRPEGPIVHYPAMLPITPLLLCLAAAGLGYFISRTEKKDTP